MEVIGGKKCKPQAIVSVPTVMNTPTEGKAKKE